ncbi:MAG: hypothetical protein PHH16_01665 [Candidatus Gracilibacteria bacterium]|nr:hypothetical protein [Candidatus Gracilibacteria bacterium]
MHDQYHSSPAHDTPTGIFQTREEIFIDKHAEIQVRFTLLKKGMLL